ncbi:hypothetical protein G9P44_001795 [Scheffersomyces stipitis]|nr:hypothetical protein G9P44_001795 [Scheffersomyces stipitis]
MNHKDEENVYHDNLNIELRVGVLNPQSRPPFNDSATTSTCRVKNYNQKSKQDHNKDNQDFAIDISEMEGPNKSISDSQSAKLSSSQMEVVSFPPTPNSILTVQAGPGSGKTFTMANRVAYMISHYNLEPHDILILSMTNRAVHSLRQTLDAIVGPEVAGNIELRTFHSFCASVVDQYEHIYFPNNARKQLIDDVSWSSFSNIFSGKTISLSGKKVEGTITASTLEKILHGIKSGEFTTEQASNKFKVSKDYIHELLVYLEQNGMMRFQDFVADAISIMDSSISSSDEESWIPQLANYKVVIVDEIQDMHHSLLSVIKKVTSYPTYDQKAKHLTLAGDPNQCIYEFLGSSPDLLENIEKEFPTFDVNHYYMRETYRLTPEILDAVTAFSIRHHGLKDVSLTSVKPESFKPVAFSRRSASEECDFMVGEITRLIFESGGLLRPSDFLILTRTNKEIQAIEDQLRDSYGMKSNKFSQNATWASSKVHVLLDILNVLKKGPGSDFALLCVLLRLDKRPGGRLRLSKLFNIYDQWRIRNSLTSNSNLEDFVRSDLEQSNKTSKGVVQSKIFSIYKLGDNRTTLDLLSTFLSSVREMRQNLAVHQTPMAILESLLNIMEKSTLLEYLNSPETSGTGKAQKLSIEEQIEAHRIRLESSLSTFYNSLRSSYTRYVDTNSFNETFLEFFLKTYNDHVTILNEDMINLSTIHMAKGLEFPVVFVPGNSSAFGTSQNWSSLFTDGIVAQDSKARLFYVACTRAKSLLYIGTPEEDTSTCRDFFRLLTTKLPTLATKINSRGSLLDNLGVDLKRTVPNRRKIEQGRSFYAEIPLRNHATDISLRATRNLHISHCRTTVQNNVRRSMITWGRYILHI